MPSSKNSSEKKGEKAKAIYTLPLDVHQIDTLAEWCESHGWTYYEVNYAQYAYRTEDINLVAYKSGKVVIQGKKTQAFVKYVLEPEITHEFKLGLERFDHPEWFIAHAGMDESGKGDLFGPLVTACVIAGDAAVDFWLKNGLKESKQIANDARLFQMEALVKKPAGVVIEVACMSMEKYNQLYPQFGNLNNLLAWLHAKALENALKQRFVPTGVLDQFTKQKLVQKYLHVEGFSLDQHVHAEEDPVVAAASIVARAEYVRRLNQLSEKADIKLPKGSGVQAKDTLRSFIAKYGYDTLNSFVKMHFKTVLEV